MRPGATSLNSNMIRDGHPACRLKPASPAVPAASAKEENKNNNDEKCLGIHDVQPFQCDGFGLGLPPCCPLSKATYNAARQPRQERLRREIASLRSLDVEPFSAESRVREHVRRNLDPGGREHRRRRRGGR